MRVWSGRGGRGRAAQRRQRRRERRRQVRASQEQSRRQSAHEIGMVRMCRWCGRRVVCLRGVGAVGLAGSGAESRQRVGGSRAARSCACSSDALPMKIAWLDSARRALSSHVLGAKSCGVCVAQLTIVFVAERGGRWGMAAEPRAARFKTEPIQIQPRTNEKRYEHRDRRSRLHKYV